MDLSWKSYSFFITVNYHWIQHEWISEFESERVFDALQELRGSGPSYSIVGYEVNKEGRPHTHWYIRFKNSRSFKSIQKIFPTANIQKRKGTEQQAINYCKKDGVFEARGKPSRQGERTDLQTLARDIQCGRKTCEEILMSEAHAYHCYGRTLEKIEDTLTRRKKRTIPTRGLWLYGESGVGKSGRAAYEYEGAFWKTVSDKEVGWWDGYRGERAVVIDEFRGEIPFSFMLRLMDRHPLWVPRRSREPFPFTSEVVVVTSRYHPSHVFKDQSNEEMKQLYRRCEVIKLMKDSIVCDAPYVPRHRTYNRNDENLRFILGLNWKEKQLEEVDWNNS